MIEQQKEFTNFNCYQIDNMTVEDRTWLTKSQRITNEMLDYAIDPYESARMEFDDTVDKNLMIFDVVTPTSQRATTEPVSFLYDSKQTNLYIFTRKETAFVMNNLNEIITTQNAITANTQPIDVILKLTESLSGEFMRAILAINHKRLTIQSTIKATSPTQLSINQLMSLQTDLIYLINSLQTDRTLLISLKNNMHHALHDDQIEKLEDVVVELQQALDTGNLSQEVTSSVANAFDNAANANLNWTMKLLTVSSIVLTVPTIVSGFFGQNVMLPLTKTNGGWIYTIVITIIFMIIITLILWHYGFFKK